MIRMLYVCNEDRATTRQRLKALTDMGIDYDVVYTSRLDESPSLLKRVFRALKFRVGYFPERNKENRAIMAALGKRLYDVLFVEKGLSIKLSTLTRARGLHPRIILVSYSLDDMMNPANSSRQYRSAVSAYDFHFTNKKYNVEELRGMGAKNVFYFRNAFSSHVHHPIELNDRELEVYGADVSFIGTYEKDRVALLRYLADNGIRVKVWGWGPSARRSGMIHPNITMTGRYVYDEEYPKVVCASRINLCLLRKINRDRETTRSIEIPACGGFMLAEDTQEHRELFRENVEAVYFTSREDLLHKVRYYLQNDERRKQVALNGYQRCIRDDYSYQNQFRYIFSKLGIFQNNSINETTAAI